MPTYRLTIEYDGSKFSGWQAQLHHRTVQGVLVTALREILGDSRLTVQGAGRTDAGVHALAQVASLRCSRRFEIDRVMQRLDKALAGDLAVLEIRPAADSFHARHDAVARCYRYQLTRRRSAFGKRATWWVPADLDVERMRRAAAHFVGRHDYAAFARSGHQAPSTIVVVDECRLFELGELVLVRLVASHFLWGQVRRMVGALVAVGTGAADPDDVRLWLARSAAPPEPAAPASGLFLERVSYRDEPRELPPPIPVGVPWHPQWRGAETPGATARHEGRDPVDRNPSPPGPGRTRRSPAPKGRR